MAQDSSIEWTDATWNPITGCRKVSPGCDGCYAIRDAHRMAGNPNPKISAAYRGLTTVQNGRLNWTGAVRCLPERLLVPLSWRKPRRVFVNSQSDLFHEDVPDEFIWRVFCVMAVAHEHTFQVLTKRPERMARLLATFGGPTRHYQSPIFDTGSYGCDLIVGRGDTLYFGIYPWPLSNVWLGVSVEDQKRADERIPLLLQTPAAVRFLSAEPLLGPVDLARWLRIAWQCSGCREYYPDPYLEVCPGCGRTGYWTGSHVFNPPGGQRGSGIDWLIAGGESGPGARPMHPGWVRDLRDQCQAAGVAFFFKQWGEWLGLGAGVDLWENGRYRAKRIDRLRIHGQEIEARVERRTLDPHLSTGTNVYRVGKKRAGRLLDGRTWDEMPEERTGPEALRVAGGGRAGA